MTSRDGQAVPPIVVGVDGTRASSAALAWAAAHGAATGQPVRAVMVVAPSTVPTNALDGFALFVPEPDAFECSAHLERAVERAVADPSARAAIERRVLSGAVAERLLDEAEGASMLVLGQSSTVLGRRLLGVARQLVGRAPCPVVVVPAGATTPASIDLDAADNRLVSAAS